MLVGLDSPFGLQNVSRGPTEQKESLKRLTERPGCSIIPFRGRKKKASRLAGWEPMLLGEILASFRETGFERAAAFGEGTEYLDLFLLSFGSIGFGKEGSLLGRCKFDTAAGYSQH